MAGENRQIVARAGVQLIPWIENVDFDQSQAQHAGQHLGSLVGAGVNQGVQQANPGQQITQNVQHQPASSTGRSWARRLGTGIVSGIAAIGIGKLLSAGVKTASSNADARNVLAAQLGLSAQDAKKAGQLAGKLYTGAYGESMEDVREAVNSVIGSVGGFDKISSKSLENVSKAALNVKSAFGVEVADSVSLVSEMVQNKLVPDFDTGFDYLIKSMQKVSPAFRQDVLDGLREYTPYLHDLGFTAEQSFNTLVAASKNGAIGMDKSLDAIKEFGIRSTDLSSSTVAAYKALGLNPQQITDQITKGGSSAQAAIQNIVDRLSKVPNQAQKSNIAISLFGTQLEDLGTNGTGIDDFLNSLKNTNRTLGDVKGTAAEVDKQLGSTTGSTLEGLQRQFEQTLGEIAVPVLEALVPILKDVATWLTENKDTIKEWAQPLLIIGGIIAAIVSAASLLAPVLSVIGSIATLFGAGGVLAGAGAAIAGAFGAVAAAIGAIAVPVLIVIAVIAVVAGLAYLIITNWEGISGFFSDLWAGITGFFSDAVKNITGFFSDSVQNIQAFFAPIVSFFSGIVQGVLAVVYPIVDFFRIVGQLIFGFLALPFILIGNFIAQTAIPAIQSFFAPIVDWFAATGAAIGGFFVDATNTVMGAFSAAAAWAQTTFAPVLAFFGMVGSFISGIFSTVGGFIGQVFSNVATTIANIWNGIVGFIGGAINAIIGGINGFLSFVFGALQQVSGVLSTLSGGLINVGVDMPQIPQISVPQMAKGGKIPARSGGTLAVLGEAGKSEVVMNEGLYNQQAQSITSLNKAVIDQLAASSGQGGDNYNIDATNMDPRELVATLRMRRNLTRTR